VSTGEAVAASRRSAPRTDEREELRGSDCVAEERAGPCCVAAVGRSCCEAELVLAARGALAMGVWCGTRLEGPTGNPSPGADRGCWLRASWEMWAGRGVPGPVPTGAAGREPPGSHKERPGWRASGAAQRGAGRARRVRQGSGESSAAGPGSDEPEKGCGAARVRKGGRAVLRGSGESPAGEPGSDERERAAGQRAFTMAAGPCCVAAVSRRPESLDPTNLKGLRGSALS
jgi:hypothetical protein